MYSDNQVGKIQTIEFLCACVFWVPMNPEPKAVIFIISRLGNPLGCETCKQALFLNLEKVEKQETKIITDFYQA